MFYGFYDHVVFNLNSVEFDFPLAFFLVMLSVVVVNLVVIVVSSAKSFYKT